jgi:hypothetical protein
MANRAYTAISKGKYKHTDMKILYTRKQAQALAREYATAALEKMDNELTLLRYEDWETSKHQIEYVRAWLILHNLRHDVKNGNFTPAKSI